MKKVLFCAAVIFVFAIQSGAIAGEPRDSGRPGCPGGGPGPWGGAHYGEDHLMHRQEMFKQLDKDGDGKLSREEANAAPPMLASRFDELDCDGDGFIAFDELRPPAWRRGAGMGGNHFAMQLFVSADADKDKKLSKDEFAKAFPLLADKFVDYDLDKDGYVTPDELHRHAFEQWRMEKSQRREQRFKDADKDKDGALSKEEFSAAFPKQADKFESLDANKDGRLDMQELGRPFKKLMRGPGPQVQ